MDSDQLASRKPADLNPHCFQNQGISRFSTVKGCGLNKFKISGNKSKNCKINRARVFSINLITCATFIETSNV